MDNIQNISPFEEENRDLFGSKKIKKSQIEDFPEPVHRLLRRGVINYQRGVDNFTTSIQSDRQHSIITGVGPSGSMHLGHVVPLYFARYLQDQTGARVYIPISDDEKFLTRDESLQSIQNYARENIRDILAIGFDPSKTRIIIDIDDSSVIYPLATKFASDLTTSEVDAVYGDSDNIGEVFYPSVQVSHLLLPQLVYGEHSSVMISGYDQDPHVRIARDIADKSRYPVSKPGCLLSKHAPSLTDPNNKMSSSGAEPIITLNDTKEELEEKIMKHAYSGGKKSKEKHIEEGGIPSQDVPYKLLYYLFEEDDEKVRELHDNYKKGEILSGEMKQILVNRVSEFLKEHRARKKSLDPIEQEIKDYRLTKTERQSALTRVGYSTELFFD